MFGMGYNGQILGIIMEVKNVTVWLSMSSLEILAETARCFARMICRIVIQLIFGVNMFLILYELHSV